MEEKYLIWSNDAGAWWKPNNAGYTMSTVTAGRYTREEALRTCCYGRDGWKSDGFTPEIPVKESDVLDIEGMQQQRNAERLAAQRKRL